MRADKKACNNGESMADDVAAERREAQEEGLTVSVFEEVPLVRNVETHGIAD